MNIVPFVLQVCALACFAFAAFHLFEAPPSKPAWGWLGLGLWLLSLMVSDIALHATRGVS